uniref:CBM21 domain-containing protein n=1 Tax=Cynoglossus semilaevis TaxID=244447 RepID=A0A3P8WWR2_CYNSE
MTISPPSSSSSGLSSEEEIFPVSQKITHSLNDTPPPPCLSLSYFTDLHWVLCPPSPLLLLLPPPPPPPLLLLLLPGPCSGSDDDTNVHLIPRCSPVPRKRGSSIFDETAEYMRFQQALSAGKKVSFADTTGGDLVDVKEFVAFGSEDEEEEARWEEEEAKYRKPELEPIYTVQPEFCAATGVVLLQTVRTDKVAVERLFQVENEPLAVSGLIRVLNISFHKAVYIRSTMDNWVTYFDHPAEYVHGSNDGDTDQFSFKLSFSPPYVTHGSRIEFVVRYETSDGDFWANNSSKNYVVTLLYTMIKAVYNLQSRDVIKFVYAWSNG